MSALQTGGYVVTGEKGEKLLLNRKKLMSRWIEDYAARLRPRPGIGNCYMFPE